MSMAPDLKVVPSEVDGWDVIRADEGTALTNHPTKESAERAAELRAREESLSEEGTGDVIVDPDHPHGIDDARRMSEEAQGRKIRVVVAKPGLDGHDRGAKIIARALRDAGMEVIYTGLHQTPEQIAATVVQEDADAVGLSILSGAHMTLVPRIVELLKEQDAEDVVLTLGGTIPADDIPELKKLGVDEIFTPGASTDEIVEFIRGAG